MPLVEECRHAVPYTRWAFVLVNFTSDLFQGHAVTRGQFVIDERVAMAFEQVTQSLTAARFPMARVVGVYILAWIVGSCAVAELLGYLLHRLLHSGLIGVLSRSHMKHHLVLYGPQQDQRPGEDYADATHGEIAIGNVGLEWLVPGGTILGAALGLLWLLQVPMVYQVTFAVTTLTWSFWVFSYLHDRMHVKGFWMERNPFLKRWFCWARNLHDIHHRVLNDRGLMDKNLGIGFAFFDWLFGTMTMVEPPFNNTGLEAAKKRFDLVLAGEEIENRGTPTTKSSTTPGTIGKKSNLKGSR
jgi:sterol desaturase/sphingolipid hydroxylase (fatty acid hydroxylase superfamily)